MKNILDKSSRKKSKHTFVFNTLSSKMFRLWDNTEKYSRSGEATDDNMGHAHFALGT
jgi:hypothetical protein